MTSPEPRVNPNPRFIIDPPWILRKLISRRLSKVANVKNRDKRRAQAESRRLKEKAAHRVEYFHQLDDPYCHLTAQIVKRFCDRYKIELVPHLVRAAGGKNQPELAKLAIWARRDCSLIAPYYGFDFPADAATIPGDTHICSAANTLSALDAQSFVDQISSISDALWKGQLSASSKLTPEARTAQEQGAQHLSNLGHYSGGVFYYAGEFYWGVDRLFHLEQRLMDLGARNNNKTDYLAPRPDIDVAGIDASSLTLHFYPSLNSPYTSIIYDKTIEMAKACGIKLEHKPVLPMIMRGVPASRNKGSYIMFDTKREAEHLGVPFGPLVMPIGEPTRRAYSLMTWAKEQGKDTDFLSALLRLAFSEAVSLASKAGMRRAVTEAGLDWRAAKKIIGNDDWQAETAKYQEEMVEEMGLWGVPSFRLSGPAGEPDLALWGQDRLWLIAAEIRKRCFSAG